LEWWDAAALGVCDDCPVSESLAGKLLVASPKLVDPNFHRSVVYICGHDEKGAFGVVINRPLMDVDVGDHLPGWREAAAEPKVVFAGGPVEPSIALGLARAVGAVAGEHWTQLRDGLGLVNLGSSPAEAGVAEIRVFVGHAGWAAGQLEGEIAEEAWFVVDSAPGDLFSADPASAWRDVLRRQRGKLAMFAFHPPDPTVN
jgi:putative transcriptional regulator